jgi:hypothetical protein
VKVVAVVAALLVVVGAGAVVADRVLDRRAEDQIATAIEQNVDGVKGKPVVHVEGFPFVTQLAAGSLAHVTGTIDAATLSGVMAEDITFDGRHVSTTSPHTIGEATVTATLPTASLEELVDQRTGLSVHLTSANGTLRASGEVLGLPLTADVEPSVDAGRLVVNLQRVTVGGVTVSVNDLPGAIANKLKNVTIPVTGLPEGLTLSGVTVVDDGARVTATGHDVRLPTS